MTARDLAAATDEQLLDAVRDLFDAIDPAPDAGAYDWRALTIRQPWAAAIVHGPKNIENRTRQTHRRGPILIHAGASIERVGPDRSLPMSRWAARHSDPELIRRGALVGVAQIVDCHPAQPWWRGCCCSPWGESGPNSEGTWHWVLDRRRALPEPVPARGALGFWRPGPDVLAAVLKQIGGAP